MIIGNGYVDDCVGTAFDLHAIPRPKRGQAQALREYVNPRCAVFGRIVVAGRETLREQRRYTYQPPFARLFGRKRRKLPQTPYF